MATSAQCLQVESAGAAACAKAKGWPASARLLYGTGTPEGNVIGYWPNDQFLDTEGGTEYRFNGTPGEATGWV